VQNTSVCLDWLSGTFPVEATLDQALQFLGKAFTFKGVHFDAAWTPMERGAMGYKGGVVNGDIKVFHDGGDNMGVHFQLSGKAVKQFLACSNINDETELRSWLAEAIGEGVVFTRCDWACDDRSQDKPLLDLAVIRQAVADGSVVSRFKSMREQREWELGKRRGAAAMKEEPGLLADVLYFGSIMSEMSVCFYDKAKEQLLPGGERWVRCELRAKKDRSQALVLAFVQEGFSAVVGVLRGYLDFRQAGSDSNVSRWSTVSWWSAFLGACERVRLAVSKPERTVARVREWMLKQVAPMFAVLWESGHQAGFVHSMVEEGKSRWGAGHRNLVAGEKGAVAWAR
jgi:DNA relaxase NicK